VEKEQQIPTIEITPDNMREILMDNKDKLNVTTDEINTKTDAEVFNIWINMFFSNKKG